jgi:hypothetical protein
MEVCAHWDTHPPQVLLVDFLFQPPMKQTSTTILCWPKNRFQMTL